MKNRVKKMVLILTAAAVTAASPASFAYAAQIQDGTKVFESEEAAADLFSDGTELTGMNDFANALVRKTGEQVNKYVKEREDARRIIEKRQEKIALESAQKVEEEKAEAIRILEETQKAAALEAKRKAEEARLEAERKAEKARLEAERKAEEARLEAERKAEEARLEAERKAEEARVAARQEIVDFALQFEGNPYVYGGTSLTNGADCSGFVMSVFQNFGYSLPRVAAAQCDASVKKDASEIEPGDLVFYGSPVYHVALYIGDGKVIHASTEATGIKISDYNYQAPSAIGTYLK